MRLVLLIIFFVCADSLFAQSKLYPVNHYTTKDGLSNNEIGCILEDSRGFLWISTKEGLNRFDGFQFKKYFSENNNPASLVHNNIRDLIEYKPNQLLIATVNGLSVLNTITGKFENEKIKTSILKPGLGNTMQSLYKDRSGNIWVNHNGELDILNNDLLYLYRFTDLPWAKNCKGTLVSYESWQTDSKNRIWFLSDTSGINIVDLSQKKVFNAKNNPEKLPFLEHDFIRSFLVDEQTNVIWYTPWGRGLFRYDLRSKTQQQINFGIPGNDESRTINSIVKTEDGNILCFVDGKCYEVDKMSGEYKEIVFPQPGDHRGVGATTIFKTKNGQYWVGGTGLWLFDNRKDINQEVLLNTSVNKPTGNCTDMFISQSGKLYCTYTNNLLVVLEKNRAVFSNYHLPSYPANMLTEVAEDGAGQIWVGSEKGLYLFNQDTKAFNQPTFLPPDLRDNHINVIYPDNEGNLWIGTREPFSFFRFTIQTRTFEKISEQTISHFSAFGKNSRISDLITDHAGNIWMTSKLGGGILCYERKNNTWKHYPPAGKNVEFLKKKGLTALYTDEKGFLWFSNYLGDGLIRYNYLTDSVDKFTRSDGIPSDYIQNISGDKNGALWLTTQEGITNFNTRTLRSGSTLPAAGLSEDQQVLLDHVNDQIALSLPGKVLFIPTNREVISRPSPIPILDRVIVNNTSLLFDPLHPTVLNYEQNNITIDFTAVNLSLDKIRFAYKLSGVDKEWKFADITRSAQYSILEPGSYSFFVKSSNEKEEWSQEYELLSFVIHPPWWKTGWFRLLAIAFIIAAVYFFMKRRIQQVKKESGLKHRIAETEMMALRAQMNPHFIFNCINSIDALIQDNDKYHATVYLNKFARLIRNILDSSKQNTVTLAKDLDTLKLYIELEQLRHENKFTAVINAEPELLQDDYKVPPLIIQPFVENAILHGIRYRMDNNGKLLVSVTKQNDYLKYIIEDNGVGRHANTQAQKENLSYGIEMSNDRVKLFNNEENASVIITDLVKNNLATGTKIEVLLRIQ